MYLQFITNFIITGQETERGEKKRERDFYTFYIIKFHKMNHLNSR